MNKTVGLHEFFNKDILNPLASGEIAIIYSVYDTVTKNTVYECESRSEAYGFSRGYNTVIRNRIVLRKISTYIQEYCTEELGVTLKMTFDDE